MTARALPFPCAPLAKPFRRRLQAAAAQGRELAQLRALDRDLKALIAQGLVAIEDVGDDVRLRSTRLAPESEDDDAR